MSAASEKAAREWRERQDHGTHPDRRHVYQAPNGVWVAAEPVWGLAFTRRAELFDTHAEAIAWAHERARKEARR